jgi:peptidoglycan-associated lipoprotein
MRRAILLIAAVSFASVASAQVRLPVIIPLGKRQPNAQQQPLLQGIDALRADLLAKAGTDTVYFGASSAVLGVPAKTSLAAQALWLRQHPEVAVRIEGHADSNDTRDHALAMGARRAEEVRQYLILMGVPAAQLSVTSLGKERPGAGRAVTVLTQ